MDKITSKKLIKKNTKSNFLDGNVVSNKTISDSMGIFDELSTEYDNVARALFYQNTSFNDCRVENLIRLFKNADGIGLDLFSHDILRGRDHGLQPYYVYVLACHGKLILTFDDLLPLIPQDVSIN